VKNSEVKKVHKEVITVSGHRIKACRGGRVEAVGGLVELGHWRNELQRHQAGVQ
jgi:hypothetical protein